MLGPWWKQWNFVSEQCKAGHMALRGDTALCPGMTWSHMSKQIENYYHSLEPMTVTWFWNYLNITSRSGGKAEVFILEAYGYNTLFQQIWDRIYHVSHSHFHSHTAWLHYLLIPLGNCEDTREEETFIWKVRLIHLCLAVEKSRESVLLLYSTVL